MSELVLFALGLVTLTLGANLLVGSASALGRRLRIDPIVIGTTVVALGTSLPEFVVSMTGQLTGAPGISLGNVVGSNVANLGLILGAAALLVPLPVKGRVLAVEYVAVLGTTILLYVLCGGGTLDRREAAGLTALFLLLLFVYVRVARRKARRERAVAPAGDGEKPLGRLLLGILAGLGLLAGGSWLLVENARAIAAALGVPDYVIGVTLVAVGTSLPELATCVVAGLRRESEIAVGNVLGSNVFNTCFVLGPAALVKPLPVPPDVLAFDLPVMLLFTAAIFPFLLTGRRLGRLEGGVLLLAFGAYMALHHPAAAGWRAALIP